MEIGPDSKSIHKLESVLQNTDTADFFSILFQKAGIRIVDTLEVITCYHQGTHITFEKGLDQSEVDYVIDLNTSQIDDLVELLSGNQINDQTRYDILKSLFLPAIDASVNPFHCLKYVTKSNGILSNPFIRRLFHMEDLLHIYMVPPGENPSEVGHTLIFAGKEWLVFPGLHGNSGRVFKLNIEQTMQFHGQAFTAIRTDSHIGWLRFARWYLKWRSNVSQRIKYTS